jgi:hypothetical protein
MGSSGSGSLKDVSVVSPPDSSLSMKLYGGGTAPSGARVVKSLLPPSNLDCLACLFCRSLQKRD